MTEKRWIFEASVTRVIDGDTIEANLYLEPEPTDYGFGIKTEVNPLTFTARLRIRGIDAHETHGVKKDSEEYARGMIAKAFVENWVKTYGPMVKVETFKKTFDRYEADVWDIETGADMAQDIRDAGLDKLTIIMEDTNDTDGEADNGDLPSDSDTADSSVDDTSS